MGGLAAGYGPGGWESRYLIYPGLAVLPRVVYAVVNAQMRDFGLSDLAKLVRPSPRAT